MRAAGSNSQMDSILRDVHSAVPDGNHVNMSCTCRTSPRSPGGAALMKGALQAGCAAPVLCPLFPLRWCPSSRVNWCVGQGVRREGSPPSSSQEGLYRGTPSRCLWAHVHSNTGHLFLAAGGETDEMSSCADSRRNH